MKKGWTEVALGEVLQQDRQYVTELEPKAYKKLSVKLYGRGVTLDPSVNGADVKMEKHQFAKAGQVIVSEIWAKKGAIGVVPADGEGALITSHFFIFDIAPRILLPGWMRWILNGNFLERQLSAGAFGTTGYAAVRPATFLAARIPLPPLAEQQRIVAHLDAIESRLTRAQKLREEQEIELKAVLSSAFHKLEAKADWVEMGNVAPLHRRPIEIAIDGEYDELGARSFGKGIFHKPTLRGESLTWQKLFQVHTGDIVISNIKAWEGAIAVAGEADHGRYGSHRYLTCVVDPKCALPEFVCFYLLSASGLEQVGLASPGSADRNRTLAVDRLHKIKVPVVPLATQLEFKKLIDLQSRVRTEAAQSRQRTTAILPSLLDRLFNS
jgi:type I restriction enzyme, S subunit